MKTNHHPEFEEHPKFSFFQTLKGRAILLSLLVGLLIVAVKIWAYIISASLAMMADMLESLVHNLAVAFAVYCMWLSHRPADEMHQYGHGKSQYLSAAVEGALVCGAGILILVNSGRSYWYGYDLLDVQNGAWIAFSAAIINSILGGWLIYTGRKENALILVANGKHILSDVITTGAALVGMLGAWIFQWIYFDLLVAVIGGIYILFEGLKLLREAGGGLLDEADQKVDQKVRCVLEQESNQHDFHYHDLRHRSDGTKHWMEIHLVMDDNISLQEAHDLATHLESSIRNVMQKPITITTHLEPTSSTQHTKEGAEENQS